MGNNELDIIILSRDGDIEKVKSLIVAGADVNAKCRYGYTALSHASYGGHTKIVKLLKDAGAK